MNKMESTFRENETNDIYTWIFLLCVKFVPKITKKTYNFGRNFTYLEDPGILYIYMGVSNNRDNTNHPF